ncbi:hypothetical protein GGR52DRAFT_472244 [Hypoxylon sp. FL1284]|nr:hypothetical protein GGR52DRAFT_472244 [Hypoxylon sp. FL1284]
MDIFQSILEGCTRAIALQAVDFQRPGRTIGMNGFAGDEAASIRSFSDVIRRAFDIGLTQQATKLIDESCDNICQSRTEVKIGCSIIIRGFLINSTSILTEHKVPPRDPVRNLYATLIRDVLVGKPPERPAKPLGWKQKPRGCHGLCQDCAELNAFLVDSEQASHLFRVAASRRQHIQQVLPADLFLFETVVGGMPHALVVTKTHEEYKRNLTVYSARLSELAARVDGLQGDYVRSLLGDDVYDELVLLKDIVCDDNARQAIKRKANEHLDGSIASRPKLIG